MKSKSTAMWLALLLGNIGAHKFYLGETGKGWLYLVFFWTYIPGLAGLVEGIGLARMSEQDFNQKYNPQAAVAYTSAPAPAQTQQGANGAPEAANPPLVRRGLLLALAGMVFFFFVFVALSPSKPSSYGRNPAASAQPSEQAAGAAARPKGDLVPGETIEYNKCKFELTRGGRWKDAEGLLHVGVALRVSHTDKYPRDCPYELRVTSPDGRVLASDDSMVGGIEPGESRCDGEIVAYKMYEPGYEIALGVGAFGDGLLNAMVHNTLHKQVFSLGGLAEAKSKEEWNSLGLDDWLVTTCEPVKAMKPAKIEPGAAEGKPAEPLDGSPAGQAWRRLAEASLPGEDPADQLERWCKANIKPKFPNFSDFDLCTPSMPWWSAPQDFQTPGSNSLEVRDNENKRADIAAAWAQAPIVLLTENHGASRRSKGYNEKTSTFSLTLYGPGFGHALSFKPISVKGSGISIGKYSAIDYMNPFEVHVPCNEDVARKLYKVLDVDASCEHDDHGCGTSDVVWKVIGKVESIGFLGKDCSQGMYGDCLKTFGPVIKPLGVRVSLEGGGKEVSLEKDSVQDINPGTVLFQWISPDAPL